MARCGGAKRRGHQTSEIGTIFPVALIRALPEFGKQAMSSDLLSRIVMNTQFSFVWFITYLLSSRTRVAPPLRMNLKAVDPGRRSQGTSSLLKGSKKPSWFLVVCRGLAGYSPDFFLAIINPRIAWLPEGGPV